MSTTVEILVNRTQKMTSLPYIFTDIGFTIMCLALVCFSALAVGFCTGSLFGVIGKAYMGLSITHCQDKGLNLGAVVGALWAIWNIFSCGLGSAFLSVIGISAVMLILVIISLTKTVPAPE
jgi:hypothetical protein